MSKQEEYQLKFRKLRDFDGDMYYDCSHEGENMQFLYFANIIRSYSIIVLSEIIENIEAAQNGELYEEFFSTDSLGDGDDIIILPPNVQVGSYTIPMNDWKQLIQEWLIFIENN